MNEVMAPLLLATVPDSWKATFAVMVVLAVFLVLVLGTLATDVVLMLAVTALVVSGVISPSQALGGLSNEAVALVGILFIVGAGVRETGAIDYIAKPLLGRPKSVTGALARLTFPTAFFSAFLNNTPLVAMLIPAVADFAKRQNISASKLMIPLSYAAIFGGTCTLIGTSTNLVVQGLMQESIAEGKIVEPAFGIFEIGWVGVPAAIVGAIYLIFVGKWLLPNRQPAISTQTDPRQYTVELMVEAASPLDGQTIEAAGLRHLPGVYLAEIDRDGSSIPAVSPKEVLRGGDRLLFVGIVESVVELQRIRGLVPADEDVFKLNHPRPQRCLVEAVVSNTYPYLGMTIRDSKFRSHYNAVVVAVARNGERVHQKIGEIELQPGDTLLIEAHPSFAEQQRNSRDFFLVSAVDGSAPPRHNLAFVALGIVAAMVIGFAVADAVNVSALVFAMLAAALMLATRCVSVESARRSIEWETLLAIAASFALGKALEQTGAAEGVVSSLMEYSGSSPWLALAIVYFVTLIATELITNNAAAALMFPFALSTVAALSVGTGGGEGSISVRPFLVAIMMAASNGYATPIGYQTHLMVYGPGGYRFRDYLIVGIPLDILIGVVTIALTPYFFPFTVAK
jgi:di/tricarboxylate transporter